jgi:hypothetical protein
MDRPVVCPAFQPVAKVEPFRHPPATPDWKGPPMSGSTHRPSPRLRAHIAQADRLSRALRVLSGKAAKSDPSFLWLVGRADEVRTLVDEVVRECSVGSIDTAQACEAIGGYVDAIHVALHRRFGGSGASCCGQHLEPFERHREGGGPEADKARRRFDSGVQEIAREDSASRASRKHFPTSLQQRKFAG